MLLLVHLHYDLDSHKLSHILINRLCLCTYQIQTSEGLFFHSQKNRRLPPPFPQPAPSCLEPVDDLITGVVKKWFSFLQKLLKFEGKFDLDGKGQGHQFQIHLRHV